MSNVLPFPGETPPTDGGGPEDPMILERVTRLEQSVQQLDKKLSSVEVTLGRIEGQLTQLPKATDFGEMKGRLTSLPNWWQMLVMLISVWGAGAAIVFAIMKFSVR